MEDSVLQGENTMVLKSSGFQILIINDIEGNFLPIVGVSVFDIDCNQGTSTVPVIPSKIGLSMSFFNAIACAWEPAIEKFVLKFS